AVAALPDLVVGELSGQQPGVGGAVVRDGVEHVVRGGGDLPPRLDRQQSHGPRPFDGVPVCPKTLARHPITPPAGGGIPAAPFGPSGLRSPARGRPRGVRLDRFIRTGVLLRQPRQLRGGPPCAGTTSATTLPERRPRSSAPR